MNHVDPILGEQWAQWESLLLRFERAWNAGERPAVDAYLPAEGPLREAGLLELLCTDLEYRLKAGEEPRVEGYCRRYPELAADPANVVELIATEFEFRRRRDSRVTVAEYLERFPDYRDQLTPALSGPAHGEALSTVSWSRGVGTPGPGPRPADVGRKLPEIPGYDLLGAIGQGGMGTLYHARHQKLGRDVAIKMPHVGELGSEVDRARFLREARAAARLRHANICAIYEIGEVQGCPFIAMAYIQGETLQQWINSRGPTPRQCAEMLARVAHAVDYAHQHGVVHRDLKPSNVMIEAEGAEPVLLDFGLAKELSESESGMTQTGQVLGTPAYMSPEQARGHVQEIGPLSDVYALGAVLYECLCHRPPFTGTVTDVLRKVVNDDPVRPRSVVPQVHRDLETICLKAMAKDPRARYDSARAMADDLDRFVAGEPILARREPAVHKLLRKARRRPATSLLLLALVVGGLAAAAAFYASGRTRHLAEIRAAFESGLNREDWTADHVRDLEATLQQLAEYDAEQAESERQRLYEQLMRNIQSRMRQPRVRADDPWIAEMLPLLASRTPELAVSLQSEWDNRAQLWTSVIELAAPFSSWQSVLEAADIALDGAALKRCPRETDGPDANRTFSRDVVLTKVESRGNVEMEAVFGPGWDAAAEIGVLLSIRPEGTAAIQSLALSQDGRWLAVGTDDVKVWDVHTRELKQTFTASQAGTFSVSFSPMHRDQLALGHTADEAVRVVDVESGREVRRFTAQPRGVACLAFDPGGQRLATGGSGPDGAGEARVWDAKNWTLLSTLPGHARRIGRLALSSDGAFLATAGEDRTVILWDLAAKKPRYQSTPVHSDAVQSVRFSPDGRYFAYPSYTLDTTPGALAHPIGLMDVRSGEFREIRGRGHAGGISCIAFSPDGKTLASATTWGLEIHVGPLTEERLDAVLPHDGRSQALLEYSPDGKTLAVACEGRVTLWDVRGARCRATFGGSGSLACVLRLPAQADAGPRGRRASLRSARDARQSCELAILRDGAPLAVRPVRADQLPADRLRLRAVRESNRITFQAGQLPELTFRETFFSGHVAGRFALRWPGDVPLESLRAMHQQAAAVSTSLERGEEQYAAGRLAEAAAAFEEQARQSGTTAVGQETRFKAAMCHIELGEDDRAQTLLQQVAAESGDPWPAVALSRLWALYVEQGRFDAADEAFHALTRGSPSRLEDVRRAFPQDVRDRILRRYAAGLRERNLWIQPTGDMLTRAEQARDIHKFFQTPPRAQLGLLQVLLAIYHRTGKGDAARALLDELLREPDYWDTDRGPIERAELLLRGGWVLREQGRGDEALERVDRLLFESPGVHRPQAVFLYVERARAQAALGRPDEAQKDLDAFLKASPRGAGSYEHYAAACLLRGVLCQRRGDADGARAAWREGLYRRWPGDKDASGKPLPVTWTSTDALLYGVILAALCDDLSPEELVAIGKRFVSAAARQSTELPSLSDIPLPTRCLSTMWRTPRGQQCVAHISLQDLPAGDYCRLPLVLFSYEYVRNEAFAGELSAAQDALLWQAGNDLFDAYIARAVEIPQLVNLGLAWRGSTGIFGWAGVKNSLKPALRGPVAYLMGQRYLRLGKPAEAAQFFRSARDLAESGSELARLAQAELDGLERK